MAEDQEKDPSQQTEQPTQQRLEKAREEGQVALSREVSHFALILSLLILCFYAFPQTFRTLLELTRYYFEFSGQIPAGNFGQIVQEGAVKVAGSFALPALVLVISALVVGFAQTRFVLKKSPFKPKMENVSPMKGFKKLFGVKAILEFFKNITKLVVIAVLTFYVMRPEFDKLHGLTRMTLKGMMDELFERIIYFLWILMAVIGAVALLDYGYQKFMFIRQLRMSRQEIKEEFKEAEGDPHVRSKQKQIRQDRAKQRMMADVPKATVVITNPTHYAVALKYDAEHMDAPLMLAKGIDAVALRIKDVAKESDIVVLENPPLARALYANVDIGQEIPMEYYEVVARVIRFVLGYDKTEPPVVEIE